MSSASSPRRIVAILGIVLVLIGVSVAVLEFAKIRSENAQYAQAQSDAEAQWLSPVVGDTSTAVPTGPAASPMSSPPIATLEFSRPGSDEVVVSADRMFVGEDVSAMTLASGPGHYPTSALPGAVGNFAVAGHRTGYGDPFLHLDDLRTGDVVKVTAVDGAAFEYVVDSARVVGPNDTSVLNADPLGQGGAWITLTTCDPPHTSENRLIVFGKLLAA